MNRKTLSLALTFLLLLSSAPVVGQDAEISAGLVKPWVFALGEWDLVETNYSAEGELVQTSIGTAVFSYAMNGERLQEYQSLLREGDSVTALHLFVINPRTQEVEIARTDSGHYGFWIITGKLTDSGITLAAKHPNPDSKTTRRITYRRVDDNHFSRTLEFSTDKGRSWFVRSEWVYTRK